MVLEIRQPEAKALSLAFSTTIHKENCWKPLPGLMDSHREAARDTHLVAGCPTPLGMKCRDTRMKLLQQLTRALDTDSHPAWWVL